MSTTYLALTIGPIYKTLSGARKTRELWGGSYLFSYLMEQILEPFKDNDFIVPFIDKTLFDKEKKRTVGLFHDRAIFVAKEGDRKKLKNRIVEVLDELADNSPLDKKFVKNYFQINPVEVTLDDKENPILSITPYLDTAELFYRVAPYDESRLKKFLKEDNRYLKNRAFSSAEQKRGFPSLPEIALHELLESTDIRNYFAGRFDEEESVYEAAPYKKLIRSYHKYVAIVHADGDNMGKVVESLKNKDFQAFSKALLEFGREATDVIKNFGGTAVFAGGDDLLFFAPVVDNGRTVFELCDAITEIFDDKMKPFNEKIEQNATLSFGIGITYYKYPLYEALERSRNLLAKAKNEKKEKNAIAFEVIKHSGQTFGTVIPKSDERLYKPFLNLTHYPQNRENDEEVFLHSLHHKLAQHTKTVAKIATMSNPEKRLKNFFDNYFNESGHDAYREFFDALVPLIIQAYARFHTPDTQKENDKEMDKAMQFVYAALRFKKFLLGDKS